MKITETHCNYWLNRLYKERDEIGHNIDKAIVAGIDTTELEKSYNSICDKIAELCDFRRVHNCILEGDEGYGPV